MRVIVLLAVVAAACGRADSASQASMTYGAGARAVSAESSASDALIARADRARIQGDSGAPVWLIEISDFQCPYCKRWHAETYPAIRREFIVPGHVRMAYVNYPVEGHANAMPASEAAMCAAAQDRFWPMHDALFATQERWAALRDPHAHFESLASAAGVVVSDWRECIRAGVMRRLVDADRDRGRGAGTTGTPHFFVGDEAINGAAPTQVFRDAIARARAKSAPGTRR